MHNHDISRFGFLRYAAMGPIYIVDDTVHLLTVSRGSSQLRPIGSVSQHVKSFANLFAQSSAICNGPSVQPLARQFAAKLAELRFCLTELIECLECREMPTVSPVNRPAEVDTLLEKVMKSATAFRCCERGTTIELLIARALMRLIRPPCGIIDGMVLPLQEFMSRNSKERPVCINGKYYEPNLPGARSLVDICHEIRDVAASDDGSGTTELNPANAIARALVADMTALLKLYPSIDCGAYKVVYKDACHELQHNGRGDFLLVRGPLSHRLGNATVFVGLPIKEKTRQQMLSVAPILAKKASAIWTAQGLPVNIPICMGAPRQYQDLMTPQFTDAEAVVQWLDAAVIVATGRAGYHAARRRQRSGSPLPQRHGPV